MTSNLGSHKVHEHKGDYESMKALVMESVSDHFRPEFINRVDDIVVFHSLEKEHVRKIANIQVQILHNRLAEQDIRLIVEDEALDLIGKAGFDPIYGARPLKRSIQAMIENPLAQKLLSAEFVAGDEVIVSVANETLIFSKSDSS